MTPERTILSSFNKATNRLAQHFAKKYFDCPTEKYWIADIVGGWYCINDYFFSLDDMLNFLRYRYTPEDMFKYYDYSLERQLQGKNYMSIKDFIT